MRDVRHRIGTVEVAAGKLQVEVDGLQDSHTDHEQRIRKIESLVAKVIGGAVFGSALGGLLFKLIDLLFKG